MSTMTATADLRRLEPGDSLTMYAWQVGEYRDTAEALGLILAWKIDERFASATLPSNESSNTR